MMGPCNSPNSTTPPIIRPPSRFRQLREACSADTQCGGKRYCKRNFGTCPQNATFGTENGKCAVRRVRCKTPSSAKASLRLVCGCNGKSYTSKCWASYAGVSVLKWGTC